MFIFWEEKICTIDISKIKNFIGIMFFGYLFLGFVFGVELSIVKVMFCRDIIRFLLYFIINLDSVFFYEYLMFNREFGMCRGLVCIGWNELNCYEGKILY